MDSTVFVAGGTLTRDQAQPKQSCPASITDSHFDGVMVPELRTIVT